EPVCRRVGDRLVEDDVEVLPATGAAAVVEAGRANHERVAEDVREAEPDRPASALAEEDDAARAELAGGARAEVRGARLHRAPPDPVLLPQAREERRQLALTPGQPVGADGEAGLGEAAPLAANGRAARATEAS